MAAHPSDLADPSERRRTAAEHYYGGLADHPDAARRVGWESGAAHALRHAAIVEALAPLAEVASVVDIGCGEGALLERLRHGGFRGSYRGEDVRPGVVARASEASAVGGAGELEPGPVTFVTCDSFSPGLPRAAAVVCSGTLNTISGEGVDHDREVAQALTAMWQRAEDVLAVDVAVVDRHPPGVGLARADLARAWAHARALSPIVVVREDVIPGEALLVVARSRARVYRAREADVLARAELLLAAGEAEVALALVAARAGERGGERGDQGAEARAALVEGQALAALGRHDEALSALARAAADPALTRAARLAMAPSLWRRGDKRKAEALLEELAAVDDEARAHFVELLLGKRELARAAAVAAAVVDPWMRREVEARVQARR